MLTQAEREKLLKLCRLFSSDKLGERASAAAAAHRLLAGRDWDSLIVAAYVEPQPDPWQAREAEHKARQEREEQRAMLRRRSWARDLTDAELDIAIMVRGADPTPEQLAAWDAILQRHGIRR